MSTNYTVAGTMTPVSSTFTLNLTATPQGETPIPPDPPNPPTPTPLPPPVDTTVLTPSGGDDTGLIQDALNTLNSDHALMLSGMFQVGNTLWLDGYRKTLMADPARPSGFRSTNGAMNGHYGALLCTTPNTSESRIVGLEFDGQGKTTEMIFIDGGNANLIDGNYLHDIAYNPSGSPYAAIHSQNVVNLVVSRNRIERTTGIDGGEGVRGIWICGISGIVIVGNHVKDTGHTCISGEGASVFLLRNTVENSLTQGTGMKVCYRRLESFQSIVPVGLVIAQNTIKSTVGAGIMLQDIDGAPNGVMVAQNKFINCGREGTSFGALYSSNDANGVVFRDNRVENCRSVGGFRNFHHALLERTEIVGGSNVVWLEDNCANITMDHSGVANIGSNCNHVTVDGQTKA